MSTVENQKAAYQRNAKKSTGPTSRRRKSTFSAKRTHLLKGWPRKAKVPKTNPFQTPGGCLLIRCLNWT